MEKSPLKKEHKPNIYGGKGLKFNFEKKKW